MLPSSSAYVTQEDGQEVYPEVFTPFVTYEGAAFELGVYEGLSRPDGGSSPGIQFFREISTQALWVGKLPVFPNPYNPGLVSIYLEIIAAKIYAYYGVRIPYLAIGNNFSMDDASSQCLSLLSPWLDRFITYFLPIDEAPSQRPYLLSRWLDRFITYGKLNNPCVIKTHTNASQFTLIIKNQIIPERGLGKILAIAQWIKDNDVMGGSGGNIGYEFQVDKQGELYAHSCKIDTGEAFFNFAENSPINVELIIIDRHRPENNLLLSQLPASTQQEFLATLRQITNTPDSIIEQFFAPYKYLFEADEHAQSLQDTIGSIDNAIQQLISRREKLRMQYQDRMQHYETTLAINEHAFHEIGDAIRRMRQKALSDPPHPLYVARDSILHSFQQLKVPTAETISSFLTDSKEKVLLLLGESGIGKSEELKKIRQDLWQNYQENPRPTAYIPLLIELRKFTHETVAQCIIRTIQEEYHLDNDQIEYYKTHFSFLFLLDGYDEIGGHPLINLYQSHALDTWYNAKVIITARNTYTATSSLALFSPYPTHYEGLKTFSLAPFSPAQIEDYLNQQPIETQIQFAEFRQANPSIFSLIENPFILSLVMQTLPFLQRTTGQKITRYHLYKTFIAYWFDRQQTRLTTFLGHLPPQHIKELCEQFSENLSFSMLAANSLYVKKHTTTHSLWEQFFSINIGESFFARLACPLTTNNNAYSFIHKSLFDYFVARYLYKALSEDFTTLLNVWNTQFLTKERGILEFLVECLENVPKNIYEDKLLNCIFASKKNRGYAKAASNAITVLNKLHFNFSRLPPGSLRNICIPHHDLSGAFMPNVDLSGSILPDGTLVNAFLLQAKLCNTQLKNVRFTTSERMICNVIKGIQVAMACHPTNEDIVAYTLENHIIIASLSEEMEIQRLTEPQGKLTCLAWSAEGVLMGASGDEYLYFWETTPFSINYKGRMPYPKDMKIYSIAWSVNGKFALGMHNGLVAIMHFDVVQTKIEFLTIFDTSHGLVCSLAWAPNHTLLAAGSLDKGVQVWDTETINHCIATLEIPEKRINCIAWSPLGKLAVGSGSIPIDFSASSLYCGSLCVWDVSLESKRVQGCIQNIQRLAMVLGVAWSSNESLAISEGHIYNANLNKVSIWNIALSPENACLSEFLGHRQMVYCVAWSSAGNIVSRDTYSTIREWKPTQHNISLSSTVETSIILELTHCDPYLISGHFSGAIQVWQPNQLSTLKILREHHTPIQALACSSSHHLASISSRDQFIAIWDLNLSAEEACIQRLEHNQRLTSLAWSPNGELLAAGSTNGLLFIWRPFQQSTSIITLAHPKSKINQLAWEPNGQYLASGDNEGKIYIWNIYTSHEPILRLHSHTSEIRSLSWASHARILASGSANKTLKLWNIDSASQVPINILQTHEEAVTNILWSTDGSQLICGNGKEIFCWNTNNWENPSCHLLFGGESLVIHENCLIIPSGYGVYSLDIHNLSSRKWNTTGIPCDLWLNNCNFFGASGLKPSTKHFLKNEGADFTPSSELSSQSTTQWDFWRNILPSSQIQTAQNATSPGRSFK